MPETTVTLTAEGRRVSLLFEISEDLLREDIGIPYALDSFKRLLTDWLDTHPKEV